MKLIFMLPSVIGAYMVPSHGLLEQSMLGNVTNVVTMTHFWAPIGRSNCQSPLISIFLNVPIIFLLPAVRRKKNNLF